MSLKSKIHTFIMIKDNFVGRAVVFRNFIHVYFRAALQLTVFVEPALNIVSLCRHILPV